MPENILTVPIYYCSHCQYRTEHPEKYDGEDFCPLCGNEIGATEHRPARWMSVAVYEISRNYGGPEEGGWYYDSGTLYTPLIGQALVTEDIDAGMAHFRALNATLERGVRAKIFVEEFPPRSWPENRPHYC